MSGLINGTTSPLPQHKKYLTQRSNSKYAALHAGDNRSGRAGLGVSATGEVIIVAQENGTGGATTYDDFRDIFVKNGCVNAGSTDGSDSVFLWYDGKFKFTAGNDKDESQTIGRGGSGNLNNTYKWYFAPQMML